MDPECAAEAVEEAHSGRMTFRAAAKTFDISAGSLQKCVSRSPSEANRVGPGNVLSISDEE